MTFRNKIFVMFTLAIILAVAVVATGVTYSARDAFGDLNARRTTALIGQFQNEFSRRGLDIVRRTQGVADAEATVRMAIELARPFRLQNGLAQPNTRLGERRRLPDADG